MENQTTTQTTVATRTKFCKYCGASINEDAIICTACGRQVENIKTESSAQPNIVINNSNNNVNSNTNVNGGVFIAARAKNKWLSVLLCVFLGFFGAHKFYEGKMGMGILYLCTCGLCGIGVLIDFFVLLCKPNPYYV